TFVSTRAESLAAQQACSAARIFCPRRAGRLPGKTPSEGRGAFARRRGRAVTRRAGNAVRGVLRSLSDRTARGQSHRRRLPIASVFVSIATAAAGNRSGDPHPAATCKLDLDNTQHRASMVPTAPVMLAILHLVEKRARLRCNHN